ncbi:MAG: hypothetical protein ACTSQP_20425 [Promethearchaeota archaeon]
MFSKKNFNKELALMGFFFDIINNKDFPIPVMPIPMRIDKLMINKATLFIIPDMKKIFDLSSKIGYFINFRKFFLSGIINLIKYGKNKLNELYNYTLTKRGILNWYKNSLLIDVEIIDLINDFTYVLCEFLKLFSKIKDLNIKKEKESYKILTLEYCTNCYNYFLDRLYKNILKIKRDNHIIEERIYFEKKGRYFPSVIPLKLKDRDKRTSKPKMGFIPYLIYDDIINVFKYNQIVIKEKQELLLDLNIFEDYKIIIKESKIKYNIKNDLEFVNKDLERIL